MKKIILSVLLALGLSINSSAAESKGIIYMKSPANYQVTAMSENGNWACGVYADDAGSYYGFRWNLLTNNIELLNEASTPCSISNDGVMAGSYYTNIEGAGTIEVAATWDGEWAMLELPNKIGSWAQSITPDGHYVTGTAYNSGGSKYTSYVWKDGKIIQTIKSAQDVAMVYCISDDGTYVGGWSYEHTVSNRDAAYWNVSDGQIHDLMPYKKGNPWQAVRKFTPDNKKLLFWGGYTVDPENTEKGYGIRAILDLETNDTTLIYPVVSDPYNFEFYDMSASGTVVGYQQEYGGDEEGIIYKDGKTQYLQDYLVALGANFDDYNIAMLARCFAISGDDKAFGFMYYDDDYYTTGNYYSMIVKLDQNVTHTSPVNPAVKQLSGLLAARLTWNEPLGDKSNLKGYDVYRDGTKVNSELVTTREYFDKNLSLGTYSYTIVAVYDDGESEPSVTSEVTIEESKIQGPRNITARQRGYLGAYATWDAPESNLASANLYADATTDIEGFGGGLTSFESAIKFPTSLTDLYAGCRLEAVSFYPLEEQGSWIINVYTRLDDGSLYNLGSTTVDQELTYGDKNVVKLDKKIKLQEGREYLIGIQTNVETSSYTVQGVYGGCVKAGYTDLIRQVGEDDFYSINQMAQDGSYDMCWATSALLSPATSDKDIDYDDIKCYELSLDGNDFENIEGTTYCNDNLTAGNHNVSIKAVYSDGRMSDAVSADFKVTKNDKSLKAITPEISIDEANVTAKWNTPKNDDEQVLGYCGDTQASKAPKATSDVTEFYARVDFPSSIMKQYDGYEMKSVSFVPLSEASFELYVYENNDIVDYIEVDEPKVGEWNSFELADPISLNKNSVYRYVIHCYDCPVGESPIAIDSYNTASENSAYIMAAGESGWYTISDETGLSGNWMMRMNIAAEDAPDFDISGYDVYVDNTKVVDSQTGLTYTASVDDNNEHTLRVDAHYTLADKVVEGVEVPFQISAAGINNMAADNTKVVGRYSVDGREIKFPHRGINIIKLNDGTSKSVFNK